MVVIDDVMTKINELTATTQKRLFFTYVDFTNEIDPRPFYVGKGNRSRLTCISRNEFHKKIRNKHGFTRYVVFVTCDEIEAFNCEINLIAKYKTYIYGSGCWGANMTLGGEGSNGSQRPESAKKKACKPINQLTLSGEFIKQFPSAKAIKIAMPGSSPQLVCLGKMMTSKGFRWEFADGVTPTKRSNQARQSISDSARKRMIVQFTDDCVVNTFSHAKIASEKTGVKVANIRRCCFKPGTRAGGFGWAYADEFDKQQHLNINLSKEKRKRVAQFNIVNGTLIAEYQSVTDAFNKTHVRHISAVARGQRKHAGGFLWKYI